MQNLFTPEAMYAASVFVAVLDQHPLGACFFLAIVAVIGLVICRKHR